MKKLLILLIAVCTLTWTQSCDTKKAKEAADSQTTTIDSLRNALNESQSESSDLIETLAQIQDGFDQINEAEGRITVASEKGGKANKAAIAENMAFIQSTMKLNRELISNLQQQLRNANQSDLRTKSKLEEMVNKFTRQLEEKDKELADLRAELESKNLQIAEQSEQITTLNENVNDLSTKNEEKARTVAAQDKELNTAYYVFGTKKELRAQNILERNGDVLKKDNFNKDYFIRVDTRVVKSIKLYSKSAQLRTNHPAGSYSLEKDALGQYVLRILNAKDFWSVSKYLVITVR